MSVGVAEWSVTIIQNASEAQLMGLKYSSGKRINVNKDSLTGAKRKW